VVDNASRDDSAGMVKRDFPEVRLLAQTENTWYCGGNNIAIDAAQGDYVLLLNPDTVVSPVALLKLVAFMQAHPDYAGVTARLVYPNGEVQRTCSRVPSYMYLLLNHTPVGWILRGLKAQVNAQHWYGGWNRDTDADVEVVPGSCLLMRRDNIRLDDNLRLYFPEDDLAQRLKRPFRFIADAHIDHYEKSVTRSWLATRLYFRDMLVYTRNHHGFWGMMWLWMFASPLIIGMGLKRILSSQFIVHSQKEEHVPSS
jgi:N-acetylglucosaminyl-diphospho-decaprenol L-rhamnosyltransferase